ncbi:MAG: response regulator, partial [Polyangiaceae bacterium]
DFRTVLCENADEALGKLGENPQVVLVDAGLDNSAGYDLCQKIKAVAPNIAVVMLSSKQQPYDRAKGSAVGADDFVDKPFDTQQLLEKVTTIARRAVSAPPMAVAPMAVAPSPVVMPSAAGASRLPEVGRPRVQTLAYGSTPAPNIPPTPAPAPAGPLMASAPVAELKSSSAAAVIPAVVPAHTDLAGLPADFAGKLGGLGLSSAQVEAVLSLSREVVEQVVWEVVPALAEVMIKEELKRLLQA